MNLGLQRCGDTIQRFKGEGCRNVSVFYQADGIIDCEGSHSGHDLCAVDECDPLFFMEIDDRDPRFFHGFSTGINTAFILCKSHAHHRKDHVGEGSQITAGAQGTFLGNDRMQMFVQHGHKGFHCLQASPGKTFG